MNRVVYKKKGVTREEVSRCEEGVEVSAVFVTVTREAGGLWKHLNPELVTLTLQRQLNLHRSDMTRQLTIPPPHHQHMPTATSAQRKLSRLAEKTLRLTFVWFHWFQTQGVNI